jgi:hypothetical protein
MFANSPLYLLVLFSFTQVLLRHHGTGTRQHAKEKKKKKEKGESGKKKKNREVGRKEKLTT